jgi:hypothetical protein
VACPTCQNKKVNGRSYFCRGFEAVITTAFTLAVVVCLPHRKKGAFGAAKGAAALIPRPGKAYVLRFRVLLY